MEHGSLHKVLKDKMNRQMIRLLNEKEALTYIELMDALNITTGMLNYHLKVLNDFLVKNTDEKYALSEKGKIAYLTLKNLPEKTGIALKWKIIWGTLVISLIMVISYAWSISNFQLFPRLITLLLFALFIPLIIYHREVNSMFTGRLIYIIIGVCVLGVVLWLLSWIFANAIQLRAQSTVRFDLFLITSLIVCLIIGGLVGELIGKKMQYKLPIFQGF